MKLIAISDTHGKHDQLGTLPDGDILIHAGDISNVGGWTAVKNFLNWFSYQPHRHKIFIAGNHDRSFDPKFNPEPFVKSKPSWLEAYLKQLPPEVHYLENSEVTIEGLKFWGSPWTPWFHGTYWAFNKQRGWDIQEIWNQIPPGTDVVITHGPPSIGMIDYVPRTKEHPGDDDLKKRLQEIKPLLSIHGHLHGGRGIESDGETTYINAVSVNEEYQVVYKPWVIEINKEREIKIQE